MTLQKRLNILKEQREINGGLTDNELVVVEQYEDFIEKFENALDADKSDKNYYINVSKASQNCFDWYWDNIHILDSVQGLVEKMNKLSEREADLPEYQHLAELASIEKISKSVQDDIDAKM